MYYCRNVFTATLKKIGVLNNKHIPLNYLRGSIRQRFELLQGLMDTDGYVSKSGQCEFTTIKIRLKNNFIELVRSLVFKVSVKEDRAMCNGKDCGLKYRIQFWAFKDTPIFRLKRKFNR